MIADWTERSTAPERLIATKRTGQGEVVMTRPIYSYPQRAAYSGSGDPNKAENFVLRRP